MLKGKDFFTQRIMKWWKWLPQDVVTLVSFHGLKKQLDTNTEGKSSIKYNRQRKNPQVRKLHSHRLQESGKLHCGNINSIFLLLPTGSDYWPLLESEKLSISSVILLNTSSITNQLRITQKMLNLEKDGIFFYFFYLK